MKNLNQSPEPSQPQSPAPRPLRRRRRLNLAKMIGAIAGVALFALGLFGVQARVAWSKPMPLRHRTVSVVTTLPALAGSPLTVTGPNIPNEVSQVTFSSGSTYAGVPILVTANTTQSVRIVLPTGVTAQPAGVAVSIGPTYVGPGGLAWRSTPGTSATVFDLSPGWTGYASWFLRFGQPGTYRIPMGIGTSTSIATIRVLPLPAGAKLSVHTGYAGHPELQIANPASVPIRVEGAGLPSTLAPGYSATITPPPAYTVLTPVTQGNTGAMFQFQIVNFHGHVSYGGTVTTHRRVAYHPPHPPFRLPTWWLILAALAALLLVASIVASARGGRGGRGGRGTGKAGPKGTGANAY